MKLSFAVSRATSVAGALLLAAIAGSGCATPQSTSRLGLLEQVSDADHSRRSNRLSAVEQGPAARDEDARDPARGDRAREIASGKLHWPLAQPQVTSEFGKRGREFHEGIDLKAATGTPVLAAQDGTVIYAGVKIRGYGRMVVVRHFKQVSTIYAHNSKLLVRVGQYVRQGQKIAISGKSGHVTGPHLHFEVRDGLAALNPLEFLPAELPASQVPVPTAPLAQTDQPVSRAKTFKGNRRVASRAHSSRKQPRRLLSKVSSRE